MIHKSFFLLIFYFFTNSCNLQFCYFNDKNHEVYFSSRNLHYIIKKIIIDNETFYLRYEVINFRKKENYIKFELKNVDVSVFFKGKKLNQNEINKLFNIEEKYNLFKNTNYYEGTFKIDTIEFRLTKDINDSVSEILIFKKERRNNLDIPDIVFIDN